MISRLLSFAVLNVYYMDKVALEKNRFESLFVWRLYNDVLRLYDIHGSTLEIEMTKLQRLSARLDPETQQKAEYLLAAGYGPTDLVREGIDLLYNKVTNLKSPSIPLLLNTLAETDGEGPKDLAGKHKQYFKDLLIEKHIGWYRVLVGN